MEVSRMQNKKSDFLQDFSTFSCFLSIISDYNPTQRACRFFDRVMELHESKVDQVGFRDTSGVCANF